MPPLGAVAPCQVPAGSSASGATTTGEPLLPQTIFDKPIPGEHRAVALWLFACAAMIAVMVVLGGITRLTESGLSITEWRPVEGVLPPLGDAAWQAEFAKYQEIPQFKLLHAWMTLADFKVIYFWEWLHRLW